MKAYKVIWTYYANYGIHRVMAESPRDAINRVLGFYSDEFRTTATLHAVQEKHLFSLDMKEEEAARKRMAEQPEYAPHERVRGI